MEKEIVITQTLDEKALQKAGKSILFSRKWLWIVYIGLLVVFSLPSIIDSFNTPIESHSTERYTPQNNPGPISDSDLWSELIISLVPVIFLVVIFIIVMRYLKRKGAKNQFEQKARFFTNITYTINNAFFKKQGEGFENSYKWEDIHMVKETSQFYLIFSERFQAHVIDKAQLDPWQKEEIKEIFSGLNSKIKVSLK